MWNLENLDEVEVQITSVASPRNQIRPLTQMVSGRFGFALRHRFRPWKHCGSKRARNSAQRFQSPVGSTQLRKKHCLATFAVASCHLPVKSGNGRPAWHDFNRVDRERCLPRRLPLLRVFAAIRQAYDKASPSAGYLKACLSVGSKRPSIGN